MVVLCLFKNNFQFSTPQLEASIRTANSITSIIFPAQFRNPDREQICHSDQKQTDW